MDGIRIVRAGRQWTVHWNAFRHYRRSLRGRFDVVIDEINTIPFFTPFWAGIPTLLLIFQLAREVWWYESSIPISAIGYLLEPVYLRGYRKAPVVTISKSTEQDLRKLGFQGPITIIPIGIEQVAPAHSEKANVPTFLYVGRLAPSKRIGHMVQALAQFRQATGAGRLWLAGSGSDRYQRAFECRGRRRVLGPCLRTGEAPFDDRGACVVDDLSTGRLGTCCHRSECVWYAGDRL